MSTPLLEDVTLPDAQTVLRPDPQCASPAYIEDRAVPPIDRRLRSKSVEKVCCSGGCWYTVLADDLAPATDR